VTGKVIPMPDRNTEPPKEIKLITIDGDIYTETN
jgi:hypothetical protein